MRTGRLLPMLSKQKFVRSSFDDVIMVVNMKKAFDIVKRLDIIVSAAILILIFIDVMLQVFTRITPNTIAVKWTVEMGSILLCAMLWLGLGQGIANRAHIRFTMVVEMFPKKLQKIFDIIGDLVFMAFCCVLAYHTFSMLQFYAANGTATTILRWGKCWTKLPMFIGLIVAAIRLLLCALSTLKHFNDSEPETEN